MYQWLTLYHGMQLTCQPQVYCSTKNRWLTPPSRITVSLIAVSSRQRRSSSRQISHIPLASIRPCASIHFTALGPMRTSWTFRQTPPTDKGILVVWNNSSKLLAKESWLRSWYNCWVSTLQVGISRWKASKSSTSLGFISNSTAIEIS